MMQLNAEIIRTLFGLFSSLLLLVGQSAWSADDGRHGGSARALHASEARYLQDCHIPPGMPGSINVVHVGSEQALLAHLAHGDSVFGLGLERDCTGGMSFEISAGLQPSAPALQGPYGERPVGVDQVSSLFPIDAAHHHRTISSVGIFNDGCCGSRHNNDSRHTPARVPGISGG